DVAVAVRPLSQQGVVGRLAGVLAPHGSVQSARAGEFSYQVGEVGADVEQVVEYQVTLPGATSRAWPPVRETTWRVHDGAVTALINARPSPDATLANRHTQAPPTHGGDDCVKLAPGHRGADNSVTPWEARRRARLRFFGGVHEVGRSRT